MFANPRVEGVTSPQAIHGTITLNGKPMPDRKSYKIPERTEMKFFANGHEIHG
jgi:hypothetical protein